MSEWVFGLAITTNFEVQMIACRTTGSSHQSDHLPFLDALTILHQKFVRMSIAGVVPLAVIKFHQQPIGVEISRPSDNAIGNSHYFSTPSAREVDSVVKRSFTSERIDTSAKA